MKEVEENIELGECSHRTGVAYTDSNEEKAGVEILPDQSPAEEKGNSPDFKADIGMERPAVFKSNFQEFTAIICCTMAVGASTISTGNAMLSLSKVSEEFGVIGGDLTWATGAIGLGVGSSLLIMGGVSDALGRKRSILVSFILFVIANLVCGFLHNYIALCIVRALTGVVISAATPSAAGIIGVTYKPGKRKNRAFATFAAGAPLGMVGGLLVGGIASQCLSWRAAHWFLAIVYAFLTVLVFYAAPADPPLDKKESWNAIKSLDYVGAFISLSGFTLFSFAMTQVDSTEKGWKTPYILATFLIGFFLIVALGFYEAYIPKRPIMPMALWKKMDFTLSMIIMAFCWIDFQGCLGYYSILYFEEVLNYSPLHTAACILTMGVCGMLVNLFAAFTLHIIKGKYLMMIACVAFAAAAIIWETMDIHRNYWLGPFWAYAFSVIGADLAYNVANLVTLNGVDANLQSSAAGVFNTVLQLSGTIGLGISSAMIGARYDLYGTAEETKYPDRLFDGFKNAYWLAFGTACTALVLCVFLKVGVSHTDSKEDEETHSDTQSVDLHSHRS